MAGVNDQPVQKALKQMGLQEIDDWSDFNRVLDRIADDQRAQAEGARGLPVVDMMIHMAESPLTQRNVNKR